MTTKLQLAAIAAALMLAACVQNTGAMRSPEQQTALTDQMVAPDLMLPEGAIDDATGTEIP